jgi:hypothetical protein
MKRLVSTLAAIALAAPSIGYAAPAAQSLSLKNAAAVQPVRASAAVAKKNRADNTVVLAVAGGLIILGILCAAEICDGNGDDSP